jgi:hypothetical protein
MNYYTLIDILVGLLVVAGLVGYLNWAKTQDELSGRTTPTYKRWYRRKKR